MTSENLKVNLDRRYEPFRSGGNLCREYDDIYTNRNIFFEYYKGNCIQEFIDLPKIVYNEWKYWKNVYNKRKNEPVERDTFDEYFQAFKDYWQYNTPETQKVFEEMKLLSDSLIAEWRFKYTFKSACEYEGIVSQDYKSKSKAQLWEEFKTIWNLDPEKYSENKFNEYVDFISIYEQECDYVYDEFPRNFWEFVEDNYPSYSSCSILKQYTVCKEWECVELTK